MKIYNFSQFLKESRFLKSKNPQYSTLYTSDIVRMEIIDSFFKNVTKDSNYNSSEPNYKDLIDDWDGYDDQVYIQNDLKNNKFIFWEGWVSSCWEALYQKDEYDGLNKVECIEKIIKERFPRIGYEFGFNIESYDYFKFKNKYIMKIIFKKYI